MRTSKISFIRQQGFAAASADEGLYRALMFQPRTIGGLLALGILLQSAWFFLGLSIVLAWNALVPGRNVFDAIYNRVVGAFRLGAAPAPRRFAQAMASAFALAAAAAIVAHATITAGIIEAIFAAAVVSLVVDRFCLGAYVYHVLRRSPVACVSAR